MKTIYVDAEVDLADVIHEIQDEDLIQEMGRRWMNIPENEKEKLSSFFKAAIKEAMEDNDMETPNSIRLKTLDDEMKFKIIKENFHNRTLDEIESFFT